MLKSLFLTTLTCGALVMLSGCAVQQNPAHTKVYTPVGTMDYHCPPGHRKKGQC